MPRLIEEPHTAAVDAYFAHLQDTRLVSDFAAAEMASAVSRLVRTGVLAADQASATLADFDIWRGAASMVVEVHAADVRLSGAYVRRFDLMLRAPDALHLAICRRLGARLVTFDRPLANAARQLAVVVETPQADHEEAR